MNDEPEEGELDVRVNYIKLAQWLNNIKHFVSKIEAELDRAAREQGLSKERRKEGRL